jgi:hypothetical protein
VLEGTKSKLYIEYLSETILFIGKLLKGFPETSTSIVPPLPVGSVT